MLLAIKFKITLSWKPTKYPSTVEWVNIKWCISQHCIYGMGQPGSPYLSPTHAKHRTRPSVETF